MLSVLEDLLKYGVGKIGLNSFFSNFIDKTSSFRIIYFDILQAEECVKRQDGIKSYKQFPNTIAILMVYFTRMDLVSVIVLRRVLKRHQSVWSLCNRASQRSEGTESIWKVLLIFAKVRIMYETTLTCFFFPYRMLAALKVDSLVLRWYLWGKPCIVFCAKS